MDPEEGYNFPWEMAFLEFQQKLSHTKKSRRKKLKKHPFGRQQVEQSFVL